MALDGVFIRALKKEFNTVLQDTRLTKIQEPEPNEVLLTCKGFSGERRLLLSVNASVPRAAIIEGKKESPITAPNFLMVLRKHLGNARFLTVTQPSLERILYFDFEHQNEMGDLKRRRLIMEFMGKYSNLILVDENDVIIDALRHVSPLMSSVRTVYPGRPYFIPETQDKRNPLTENKEAFLANIDMERTLLKNLCDHYTGLSTGTVSEWLVSKGLHPDAMPNETDSDRFYLVFSELQKTLNEEAFRPTAVFINGKPTAFSAMPIVTYGENVVLREFDSPSELLESFYRDKAEKDAMNARSADLRKVTKNLMEREAKKQALYEKQLKDTEDRDKYRLYGELLMSFQYNLPEGEKSVTVQNFYDENRELTIPTDPTLSIRENANRYYDKYNKLKRTEEALAEPLAESREKLSHLESILTSIDFAENERDLKEIRSEMADSGYIRRETGKKPAGKAPSKPHHYRSSDGFDIYVGRNNVQNDNLTFRLAKGNDLFFHVKKAPGSHVILVTDGREVPDRTYEEAGALAAYYSSLRDNEKAEIDYVEKKQVKKPAGAKPGFVVYYTNYSLMASTDVSGIEKIS